MANKISDETIEYVGILAKLELSGQEKEDAKADMEKTLVCLNSLLGEIYHDRFSELTKPITRYI